MAIYLRAKGRTSPPAKTIGYRESINPTLAVLKLVAKYLGRFIRRGYLIMAIYPLNMAGLVSLPKQCSHGNQSTHVFRGVPSNGNLPYNYGRTSPPAKTILALVWLNKSPPPAGLFALAGG